MANAEEALPRAYDLIVYGASGFTGRLVAEHLLGTYCATGEIKWAMAGRSTGKLAEVRGLIGGAVNLPLIAADASDPASLKKHGGKRQGNHFNGRALSALRRWPRRGLYRSRNRLCGPMRGTGLDGGDDPLNTVTPRKHPVRAYYILWLRFHSF